MKINKKVFSIRSLDFILCFLIVIFLLCSQTVFFYYTPESPYLWTFTIAANTVMILFYHKKSLPVTVLLIFSFSYFYIPKYFFWDSIPISHHSDFQEAALVNKLSILNTLFLTLFFGSLRKVGDQSLIGKNTLFGSAKNPYVFYAIAVILLISWKYGLSGETILSSGYGRSETNKSTLFEYFIVFFAIALIAVDKKSKVQMTIILLLFISYILKGLLFGGRIEALMITLVFFYIHKNLIFEKKYSTYLGVLLLMFAAVLFEHVRANPLSFFSSYSGGVGVIFEPQRSIISNQFGDVYQASLRVLGILDNKLIETNERAASFFLTVFGFAPTSWMPSYYNLSTFKQSIATSGGGGLISAFSFVWLSYLGPAFFGFYSGASIRCAYNSQRIFFRMYGMLALSFFPRWLSYYPVSFFKIILLGSALAAMIFLLKRSSRTVAWRAAE